MGYDVGTRDRAVLGYSRGWVLAAGWLAMLAVSTNLSILTDTATAALWGACYALTTAALLWLRLRIRIPPADATAVGAVLCALGMLALAHLATPAGYGVLAGVGTGLVHRTALTTVIGWYPARPFSLVSGAFAYGSIPLVLLGATVRDIPVAVDKAAFALLVAVLACAAVLREPPRLHSHTYAINRPARGR